MPPSQDDALTSGANAIDASVFSDFVLNTVGDDPAARNLLVDTYLDDAGPRIRDLMGAVEIDDTAAAAKAAHGLRSGSALFGALLLAELLAESERMVRSGVTDLHEIGSAIEAEYGRVSRALDDLRVA